MKRDGLKALVAGALMACALPAAAQEITEEETARIMALLAEMQCEMDADDIEREDGGFELDDVFCADGQYDIELDSDFAVVEKRKE
ncbi:MAG: PepSY domain-containing protein [Rubrimonas sp.]|uniref:PepSY domain-containing protein n=1 Tax=Rubrimonas sp. TaxID=2036015 RepID=UPI002FDE55EA